VCCMLSVLYLMRFDTPILFSIILVVLLALDIICLLVIGNLLRKKSKRLKVIVKLSYILVSASGYGLLVWAFFFHTWNREPLSFSILFDISGTLFSIYNPKIVFLAGYFAYFLVKRINASIAKIFIQFVIITSISLIFILFWGILAGRFIYRTSDVEISDPKLPKSFNGLKIVQISDFHLGTFMGHEKEVAEIIKIINKQQADIVVFTGDLVNCFAEEIPPFIQYLSQIKAKFAILGNHDYGDYYKWDSNIEKLNDHRKQIGYYSKFGFQLLQNEHVALVKNSDTLIIAGIENWGEKPYRQEGNVDEAIANVSDSAFILLLSHDPSFWDKKAFDYKNIRLTLSGHTHGFQLGFKLGNFEWSPFQLTKKRTAGLYENGNQKLYVNRGLGGALYPGRVGVFPEITVFTLKSDTNTSNIK
jgi:predicted MPP superfamily phosphohydrolase